ncbi:MAG: VCBS repeat-containing protein [Candidatus Electrothrix communis]|nr:VCBS repeat-containing protein [Desulfobulbus sp. US4]WLE96869.1 MAG: VCBS repeat-containing protein [Candidatus Electrothrix communis]
MPQSLLILFYTLLTLIFLTIPVTASTAETTSDNQGRENEQIIIIPPFEVETKAPRPHLQTGLANILATRITKRTNHIVAPHSAEIDRITNLLLQQDNVAVQKIIQKMANTSLLAGTLKEKEEGYEITIHVFSHRPTAQISLSQTFNQLDRALSALDELSLDIAEKIFSVPRPKKDEVIAENGRLKGFHTAHPERLFKEKKHSADEITTGPEIKNTSFGIQSSRRDILPSSTALAMTAGDLNNDGKEEFVLLEKASVALYHRSPNSSFQRIAFQPLARHLGLHTVHLADLDNNGLLEIYIGASNGSKPASQILEWDGRAFHVLYQNAPYYLRPTVDAEGRSLLLGQENALQETGNNVFYSLKRESDGSLRKIKRLTFPPGFNIYDFITVDLNLDGALEFIGITRGNKLAVIDNSGRTLWKSEKNHGASKEILGTLTSTLDGDRNPTNNPEPIYLHSRIIAQDLNRDGTPEIIIGRNRLAAITFLKRLRSFEGSSVSALSWTDGTMKTIWETPRLPGYTVDFQLLRDTNQPGKFRLVSIEQEYTSNLMSLWRAKKSLVHSYILGGQEKENPGTP